MSLPSIAVLTVWLLLPVLPVHAAGPAPRPPEPSPSAWRIALSEGVSVDGDALERQITGRGCERSLLGRKELTFSEAQMTCVAFLSFALVQASLEGRGPPDVRERLAALLGDALGRGRAPFQSTGSEPVAGHSLPRSVLYRGLLLLMLAGMERAGLAREEDQRLFDALAARTVEALSRQPLLPSFGASLWPCDNALAASGLLLHGRLRGVEASRVAGERLATHLGTLLKLPGGFPTQVDAKGRRVEQPPRGSTLAWTAAFLTMSGHPAARAFADVLLADFCERLALFPKAAACREWPRGVERPADAASGPLVSGYAQGTTALAIAATRASEALQPWHQDLRTTAVLGGIQEQLSQPARHPLETALYVWATGLAPW